MQPQSPYHPAPPEPNAQPTVPTSMSHNPKNYTAPDFTHPSAPPTPQTQDYNFIFDTPQQPKKPGLAVSATPVLKIAFILGGLLVLLMLFVLTKGLLSSGGSNSTAVLSVIEDQQVIYHISSNASTQPGLQIQTEYSAVTTKAAIGSAQGQLEAYYKKAGLKKYSPTILLIKIKKATDTQLLTAASSGLYDQTYVTIISGLFGTYQQDLKAAYNLTTDAKGKALLKTQYADSKLLVQQLNTPSN